MEMKVSLTEEELEFLITLLEEDQNNVNAKILNQNPLWHKLEEGLRRLRGIDW